MKRVASGEPDYNPPTPAVLSQRETPLAMTALRSVSFGETGKNQLTNERTFI